MNNIISAKRNSAIFLATLLVLGTIATILPSAQAQPYYEMDNRYDPEYPSEYTDNNSYESENQSYQDNSYYNSKDSNSVILNKIKCNNINSNNNGVDVNLGLPNGNNAIDEDEDQATNANGWGYGEGNNNKDFKFVCSNDNNNINIVEETISPDTEEESYLIVNKAVSCEFDRTGAGARGCEAISSPSSLSQIEPNDFTITITGNNPVFRNLRVQLFQ